MTNLGFQTRTVEKLKTIKYADDSGLCQVNANICRHVGTVNSRICVWWSQIFNGDKIRKCRSEKQIGDLTLRTNFEFDHRLHAAWAKVHTFTFFQQTHSHICEIEIETLGFRGVLSATSGFSILPLTRVQIHELDVVQRRVLRSIFGWVQIGDEAR